MAAQSAQVIDLDAYRKARNAEQPAVSTTATSAGAMMPVCFVWMPVWPMITPVQSRF